MTRRQIWQASKPFIMSDETLETHDVSCEMRTPAGDAMQGASGPPSCFWQSCCIAATYGFVSVSFWPAVILFTSTAISTGALASAQIE